MVLKNKLIIILLVIILVSLAGCFVKEEGEIYTSVTKHLIQMEGYTCEADIRIFESRGTMEFTSAHWFKSPNKYRVEIIDSVESEKLIMVYNGRDGWIYNPGLDRVSMFEDFYESGDRAMFLGSFTGHFLETGDIQYSMEDIDNTKCVVMELKVPSGNIYVDRQKIWITKNKFEPYKMEIYNIDGKKVIEIRYRGFRIIEDMENSVFELDTITTYKHK